MGVVTIDIEKAKLCAHKRRRTATSLKFTEVDKARLARHPNAEIVAGVIKQDNDEVKVAINAATTLEELKTITLAWEETNVTFNW